jgi:heterodisulfide reductase subunit B
LIPNRYPTISTSIRDVFSELGAELLEMQGASCCPAPGVFRGFHIPTWELMAARNLSIAEELKVDPLTGCNGCYGTLRDAWYELEHDPQKKQHINNQLAKVGREFKGTQEPKHIIQALSLDIGSDYISDYIKYKFNDLRIGVHYGCHILKPSDKRPWNRKSENPKFLDDLVELTGAKSVFYKDKYMCCGAGGAVRSAIKEVSLDFTREKLMNMIDVGIDAIVTTCPFCHLQFDLGQVELNGILQDEGYEPFEIPVIYITQLLGLTMGLDLVRQGFVKNHNLKGVSPFTSLDPFLDIVKQQFT